MHRIGLALHTILWLKLEVLLFIVFMQTSHHGSKEILNSRIWLLLSPYRSGFERQWANSYRPLGHEAKSAKKEKGFPYLCFFLLYVDQGCWRCHSFLLPSKSLFLEELDYFFISYVNLKHLSSLAPWSLLFLIIQLDHILLRSYLF